MRRIQIASAPSIIPALRANLFYTDIAGDAILYHPGHMEISEIATQRYENRKKSPVAGVAIQMCEQKCETGARAELAGLGWLA